jgi:predicted transcriptional regulator
VLPNGRRDFGCVVMDIKPTDMEMEIMMVLWRSDAIMTASDIISELPLMLRILHLK